MDFQHYMSQSFREGKEAGIEIGKEAGKEAKAIEAAVIAVKEFNATPEFAAVKMNAPLEKVLESLSLIDKSE